MITVFILTFSRDFDAFYCTSLIFKTLRVGFPNAKRLLQEILSIKARRFDFTPFLSFSFCLNGKWYRFVNGTSLYMALPGKRSFSSEKHKLGKVGKHGNSAGYLAGTGFYL